MVERVLASRARTVLDIGAGAGNWLDALAAAGFAGKVDAVEVWTPYITEYRLQERYREVYAWDARSLTPEFLGGYDVVIMGDVLEHMTKPEAQVLWRRSLHARHSAIAIPIVHYCQGALNGNPFEEHVKPDWSHEEALEAFPGITDSQVFTITAAYWR